jgi:hypothetical protein
VVLYFSLCDNTFLFALSNYKHRLMHNASNLEQEWEEIITFSICVLHRFSNFISPDIHIPYSRYIILLQTVADRNCMDRGVQD